MIDTNDKVEEGIYDFVGSLNNLDKGDEMGTTDINMNFNKTTKESHMLVGSDLELAKPHVEVSKKINVGPPKKSSWKRRARGIANNDIEEVLGSKEGGKKGAGQASSLLTSPNGKRTKSINNSDTCVIQNKLVEAAKKLHQ